MYMTKRQKLLKNCRVQSGQANHIIGRPHFLFVVIVDMRRTKSMRVVNKALKITYLGLNISIKLHEVSIDVFMVFFRLHGPFEASFYKITFSRRPLKEESPFLLLTASEQFITFIDFVRLMSTITNHKHIAWFAYGPTR